MDAATQVKITQLFYRNRHLFRDVGATHLGTYPDGSLRGINYKEQEERLKAVHNFHWTWSRCYVMSQFVFYYLGGYESDWELKCIKQIPFEISGVEGVTSHWFVQNSKDNRIIDLTKEQFKGVLNIDEWYEKGRRANLGFPFYYGKTRNDKFIVNSKCVPSKECLRFYEVWRQTEKNESFERYFETYLKSRL